MKRIQILTAALPVFLMLALAGCMVGPDYRRPAVDTPRSFLYEEKEARDTADTDWWKAFGDSVLDSLIVTALANNRDVQIAAANIEQAAGVLMETEAPLFPQAEYSGTATRERISRFSTTKLASVINNPRSSFQILAGANWEIDLWGRVRRLTESARADLFASEEARRGVILSLVASVASDYIQLRGLDEQLEIAKRTLTAYGESVTLFENQFKYGQVSQMNVAQAKSQYETAAAEIPQIESQIAQLENAICILLAQNPGPIPRGKSVYKLKAPAIPAGLPSELLERRPDIRQAEQSLISANAKIGAAKAQFFPTISLTGNVGSSSADLSDLFRGPARVWSYSGTITGPIFTAGSIAGQVKQATAGQKAALLSYQSAIQNAFADTENALVARRKLVEQVAAQERLVDTLRQYLTLAKLQYEGGYSAYLAVLDAEQQLFPAELNLASAHASLSQAYVSLYKAMGGGWVNNADAMTDPKAPPAPTPAAAAPSATEVTTATVEASGPAEATAPEGTQAAEGQAKQAPEAVKAGVKP